MFPYVTSLCGEIFRKPSDIFLNFLLSFLEKSVLFQMFFHFPEEGFVHAWCRGRRSSGLTRGKRSNQQRKEGHQSFSLFRKEKTIIINWPSPKYDYIVEKHSKRWWYWTVVLQIFKSEYLEIIQLFEPLSLLVVLLWFYEMSISLLVLCYSTLSRQSEQISISGDVSFLLC